MVNNKWVKALCIFSIVLACVLAYTGLSGHMSAFVGGLGWLLVAFDGLSRYKSMKRDEEMFKQIMEAVQEQEHQEKIKSLSPQTEVKE